MHHNTIADWQHLLNPPLPADNKYSRGFAFALGGEFMTGAIVLASHAAQRIGAGLVKIACPKGAADVYRILNINAVTIGFRDTATYKELLSDSRIDAFLAGPGLGDGPAVIERVMAMIRLGKPMVIDADALTLLADTRENFFDLLDRHFLPSVRNNVLLTPHLGEFQRMFPEFAELDPAEAVKAAAQLSGTTVLLKGHNSYIAQNAETLCVHAAAPTWLATAGSGDVLSGLCLGLLAQGFSAYSSACIACAFHRRAAELFGVGLTAEDLNKMIPTVWTECLSADA